MKHSVSKNVTSFLLYSFFIFLTTPIFYCNGMEDQLSTSPTANSTFFTYYEKASRHYFMDSNHEAMTVGTYLDPNYDKNIYAEERNKTIQLLKKKDRGEPLTKDESKTYGRRVARAESVPQDILSLNNAPDIKKDQFIKLKDTMGNHIPEPVDVIVIQNVKKFYILDLKNSITKIQSSIELTPEYITQNSDKKFGKEIAELIPQVQTLKEELTAIKKKVIQEKEDQNFIKNKIVKFNNILQSINPESVSIAEEKLIELYVTIQSLLNIQTTHISDNEESTVQTSTNDNQETITDDNDEFEE